MQRWQAKGAHCLTMSNQSALFSFFTKPLLSTISQQLDWLPKINVLLAKVSVFPSKTENQC